MSIPPPPIPRENPGAGLPYSALEHAAKFLVARQMARRWSLNLFTATIMGLGVLGVYSLLMYAFSTSADNPGRIFTGLFFLPMLILLATDIVFMMNPSRQGLALVRWLCVGTMTVMLLTTAFLLCNATVFIVIAFLLSPVVLVPLLSLVLFAQTFSRLKRLFADGQLDTPPSPLALTLAGDLLNRLRDASLRNDPAFFEFTAGKRACRGLLLEESAVVAEVECVLSPRCPVRMSPFSVSFLRPSGLVITPAAPPAGRTWTRCALQIDGKDATGAIAAESFARYQVWQAQYGGDERVRLLSNHRPAPYDSGKTEKEWT